MTRWLVGAFAIFLSLRPSFASQSDSSPKQDDRRLDGCVTNTGGMGVALARITLTKSDQVIVSATCDASGHFAIKNLMPTTYIINAYADKYICAPQRVDLTAPVDQCISLMMFDASSIAGKVLCANGKPCSGAIVVAHAPGKEVDAAEMRAKTDRDGNYLIRNAPVGAIDMAVIAGRHALEVETIKMQGDVCKHWRLKKGDTATYHIAIDSSGAGATLNLEDVTVITRHVLSDWSLNLESVWPFLRQDKAIVIKDLPTSLQLNFVAAFAPDLDIGPDWTDIPVLSRDHSHVMSVRKKPNTNELVRISGKVSMGDGFGNKLRIAQDVGRGFVSPNVGACETNADGTFLMDVLVGSSGVFRLMAPQDDQWILHNSNQGVHAIEVGGSYLGSVADKTHEVLASRATIIRGKFMCNASVPSFGACVSLYSAEPGQKLEVARTVCDRGGRFEFRGLLVSRKQSLFLCISSRTAFGCGPLFEVFPGRRVDLGEVRLQATGAIAGTYTDDVGVACFGEAIVITGRYDGLLGMRQWTVWTDRFGQFLVDGLPPGYYEIHKKGMLLTQWGKRVPFARVDLKREQKVVVHRGDFLR